MVKINIVNGKNKILWVSGIILVVLILFVVLRIKEVEHVPSQELSPWALNIAAVELGTVSQGFPVLAKVSTNSNITITGQISGTILKMGPRESMKVKAGHFLAQIDTLEIEENIAGLRPHPCRTSAVKNSTFVFRFLPGLYSSSNRIMISSIPTTML